MVKFINKLNYLSGEAIARRLTYLIYCIHVSLPNWTHPEISEGKQAEAILLRVCVCLSYAIFTTI